mmetsp:Transcript_42118/g.88471  ORF Transcript_42118/g.88471 Transcript_42118/m.88471 type:complete len:345 (+) Transcript_42118:3553-4587(+)
MSKHSSNLGIKILGIPTTAIRRPIERSGAVHVPLHAIRPLEEIALLSLWQGALIELPSGIGGRLGGENAARLAVTRAEGGSLVAVVIATNDGADPSVVVKVVVTCSIFAECAVVVILRIVVEATIISVTVLTIILKIVVVIVIALPKSGSSSATVTLASGGVIVVALAEGSTIAVAAWIIWRVRTALVSSFSSSIGRRCRVTSGVIITVIIGIAILLMLMLMFAIHRPQRRPTPIISLLLPIIIVVFVRQMMKRGSSSSSCNGLLGDDGIDIQRRQFVIIVTKIEFVLSEFRSCHYCCRRRRRRDVARSRRLLGDSSIVPSATGIYWLARLLAVVESVGGILSE